MTQGFIRLLLCACGVLGVVALTHAGNNCTLTAPPRAAAVSADHGALLFVFPRKVDVNYSGCQTMWNERGAILFVLTFDRGALTSYQEFAKPKRKATLSCKYTGHALKTRGSQCPPYEDVEAGFRTLAEVDEPPVPVERDPRLD